MKNFRKTAFIAVTALAMGAAFPYVSLAMDDTYQQLKVMTDVMELIKENYVENIDSQKLAYGAAKGMVGELDEFSQFMEPDLYEKVKGDTEGEFGGIGIRVDMRDGWLTVVTPLPNTPAYRAEMYPGDKIVKIEGESTREMLIEEAIKKLRGAPGTKVNITIAREPEDKTTDWINKDLMLTRELIRTENIRYRMLDGEIGYIKMVEFTGHVMEDFNKALENLKKQGAAGLVIDLRNNPGGLVSAAVDISKLFLDSNKMIIYTKGRKPENYQEFRAGASAPYSDIPLIILVNRYSASAAEIVSGAMQDNKRGLIVGERSFGKAAVQSIIPLSGKSALRLTIAKYYTPDGRSIQRDVNKDTGGITPDIEVKVSLETEKKLIQQSEEVFYPGREDNTDKKPAAGAGTGANSAIVTAARQKRPEAVRDEVLDRALELLKAREVLGNMKPL